LVEIESLSSANAKLGIRPMVIIIRIKKKAL